MRDVSAATLVCKRGATGRSRIPRAVPANLDDAEAGPCFPIEVVDVLGAGDGFFAGLLQGWLDDALGHRRWNAPTPAQPSR